VQCCEFPSQNWVDKASLPKDFLFSMRRLVEMLKTLAVGFRDQAATFINRPTRNGKPLPLDGSESEEAKATKKLARDFNVFQQNKFEAKRQCILLKLHDMMAKMKTKMDAGSFDRDWKIYKNFCKLSVEPIHDFILELGCQDELPPICGCLINKDSHPDTCMKSFIKAAKATADVDLADELSVDGETRGRHGWADDAPPKTPTPTESPQVHTASSISGMCEF